MRCCSGEQLALDGVPIIALLKSPDSICELTRRSVQFAANLTGQIQIWIMPESRIYGIRMAHRISTTEPATQERISPLRAMKPARLSPLEKYDALVQQSNLEADTYQREAAQALDSLYWKLVQSQNHDSLLNRVSRMLWRKPPAPEQGLYIWGDVGRGKTLLMDLFFDCIPPADSPAPGKLRMHFHRFMQYVHQRLKQHAGCVNPLEKVADDLAEQGRILCFDEFFVSDIGDAMILGELLRELFRRGMTLVATSNIEPQGLYPDGLQRRRFLPAIDLLKEHTQVLHLDGPEDYRLRVLRQAELYHSPLDTAAELSLQQSFDALAPGEARFAGELNILGRPIEYRSLSEDVIWFDFEAVCDGPRSQNDYIELARLFHAVLISRVPQFTIRTEDQARRFISLVDEFYDHNVKLVVTAEVPLFQLYAGRKLTFEFERTRSRLIEMSSHEYLAREHQG